MSFEKLLHNYALELNWLDMVINSNKSFCLRIGQGHDVQCGQVISSSGQTIRWKNETRYLGIYIARNKEFKCSLDSQAVFLACSQCYLW